MSMKVKVVTLCAVLFFILMICYNAIWCGASYLVVSNDSLTPKRALVTSRDGRIVIWRGSVSPNSKAVRIVLVSELNGIAVSCVSGRGSDRRSAYVSGGMMWMIKANISECPSKVSLRVHPTL